MVVEIRNNIITNQSSLTCTSFRYSCVNESSASTSTLSPSTECTHWCENERAIIHSFNRPRISSNRANPRNVIAGRLDPIQFCVHMHVIHEYFTHTHIHTKTCVSERLIWRRRGSSGCWMMPRMRLHDHASCHYITPIITHHMHTYLSRMTMVMVGCVP
jgi:hypothetical protein